MIELADGYDGQFRSCARVCYQGIPTTIVDIEAHERHTFTASAALRLDEALSSIVPLVRMELYPSEITQSVGANPFDSAARDLTLLINSVCDKSRLYPDLVPCHLLSRIAKPTRATLFLGGGFYGLNGLCMRAERRRARQRRLKRPCAERWEVNVTVCSEPAAERSVGHASLSVVVPSHNEQDSIGRVVRDLEEHLPGCEIIVVDDCSSDNTASVAQAFASVTLVRLPFNHGYGAALRQGVIRAHGDLIAWFDADSEHRASDLAVMVQRLRRERLGAVLGERTASVLGSRSAGKLLIRLFASTLGLGYIRDFNCGLRVFRRETLLRILLLLPTGYSASTTSTFLILRQKVPFAFHTIVLRPRIGQSKVRVVDGFRTLISVLRVASLLQPLRLFGGIALGLGAVGFGYSLTLALINRQGVPTLGILLMTGALLALVIAILADQLSQFRMQHSAAQELTDSLNRYLANRSADQ